MVFASNNPDSLDDIRGRCILIYMYHSDRVEDTDRELIAAGPRLPGHPGAHNKWTAGMEGGLANRPNLVLWAKRRTRRKGLPLARVAQRLHDYIGKDGQPSSWVEIVRHPTVADVEQIEDEAALNLRNNSSHTAVATDIVLL